MKRNLNKYSSIAISVVALLYSVFIIGQEFDASNYEMLYNFKTVKQHDNTRLLEVSFIARNSEDSNIEMPLFGAEIKFYSTLNSDKLLLGTVKTSKDGISKLILPEDQKYLTDKEGFINLLAHFEGTEAVEEQIGEIKVKDVHLELNLTEIDSVKTAIAKVYTLSASGEELPVEADLGLYVGGMFSKLKVGEGSVAEGELETQFEFPTDLPGDENDNLTVYLMLEDHEEFGTVIQKQEAKWGSIHVHKNEQKLTLWSKYAPLWMYAVLTFLLVGIWANFVYTIVHLFKIKNEITPTEIRYNKK